MANDREEHEYLKAQRRHIAIVGRFSAGPRSGKQLSDAETVKYGDAARKLRYSFYAVDAEKVVGNVRFRTKEIKTARELTEPELTLFRSREPAVQEITLSGTKLGDLLTSDKPEHQIGGELYVDLLMALNCLATACTRDIEVLFGNAFEIYYDRPVRDQRVPREWLRRALDTAEILAALMWCLLCDAEDELDAAVRQLTDEFHSFSRDNLENYESQTEIIVESVKGFREALARGTPSDDLAPLNGSPALGRLVAQAQPGMSVSAHLQDLFGRFHDARSFVQFVVKNEPVLALILAWYWSHLEQSGTASAGPGRDETPANVLCAARYHEKWVTQQLEGQRGKTDMSDYLDGRIQDERDPVQKKALVELKKTRARMVDDGEDAENPAWWMKAKREAFLRALARCAANLDISDPGGAMQNALAEEKRIEKNLEKVFAGEDEEEEAAKQLTEVARRRGDENASKAQKLLQAVRDTKDKQNVDKRKELSLLCLGISVDCDYLPAVLGHPARDSAAERAADALPGDETKTLPGGDIVAKSGEPSREGAELPSEGEPSREGAELPSEGEPSREGAELPSEGEPSREGAELSMRIGGQLAADEPMLPDQESEPNPQWQAVRALQRVFEDGPGKPDPTHDWYEARATGRALLFAETLRVTPQSVLGKRDLSIGAHLVLEMVKCIGRGEDYDRFGSRQDYEKLLCESLDVKKAGFMDVEVEQVFRPPLHQKREQAMATVRSAVEALVTNWRDSAKSFMARREDIDDMREVQDFLDELADNAQKGRDGRVTIINQTLRQHLNELPNDQRFFTARFDGDAARSAPPGIVYLTRQAAETNETNETNLAPAWTLGIGREAGTRIDAGELARNDSGKGWILENTEQNTFSRNTVWGLPLFVGRRLIHRRETEKKTHEDAHGGPPGERLPRMLPYISVDKPCLRVADAVFCLTGLTPGDRWYSTIGREVAKAFSEHYDGIGEGASLLTAWESVLWNDRWLMEQCVSRLVSWLMFQKQSVGDAGLGTAFAAIKRDLSDCYGRGQGERDKRHAGRVERMFARVEVAMHPSGQESTRRSGERKPEASFKALAELDRSGRDLQPRLRIGSVESSRGEAPDLEDLFKRM